MDSLDPGMGQLFASFVYRISTMSIAGNVALGSMAERINFLPFFWYLIPITIVFALPNYWVLSPSGFLFKLGVVDIAGSSYIHIAGGVAGLVGTMFLKPRKGRFTYPLEKFQMADPTNALLGTYMLWYVCFHCFHSLNFNISPGGAGLVFTCRAHLAFHTIDGFIAQGIHGIPRTLTHFQ